MGGAPLNWDLLLSLLLALLVSGAPLQGKASWYDDGPGLYGAVHSYRWGDPQYRVVVCRKEACVTVTVRDYMANPRRAIDLSPDAFRQLFPTESRAEALAHGVAQVTVRRVRAAIGGGEEPTPTGPPTDVGYPVPSAQDEGN